MRPINPRPINEIINNIENGNYDGELESIYIPRNSAQSGYDNSDSAQSAYDNSDQRDKCNENGEIALVHQKNRYIRALKAFEDIFGKEQVNIFSAPGRIEIGGNHTDHQHGQVIAASVNLDMIAVVSGRDDGVIKVVSEGHEAIEISIDDVVGSSNQRDKEKNCKEKNSKEKNCKEKSCKEDNSDNNGLQAITPGTSASLVMGMLAGFKKKNYNIGGFNAYITSDVMSGLGLSSSAAYETLIGTILSGLYNKMRVSPVDIGVIGQYAENVFFGKPCGLMDQLACSVGGLIHIDFAEPQNPMIDRILGPNQLCKTVEAHGTDQSHRTVEIYDTDQSHGTVEIYDTDQPCKKGFDFGQHGYHICIVDTGASHENMTDEYAAIPNEMKAIAKYFGKEVLREITMENVVENVNELREMFGDRSLLRAMHFLGENERVVKQVGYLKNNDIQGFLEEVKESGNSSYKYLQNVYSSSNISKQEISVALCMSEMFLNGQGVVRVHGGGFAGTIQAFVRKEISESYKEQMNSMYKRDVCKIVSIREQGGILVI